MFASPEPRFNTSNGSADTALHVDPAWSLPPAGAEAQRPSRHTSRPQRFSPEPVRPLLHDVSEMLPCRADLSAESELRTCRAFTAILDCHTPEWTGGRASV
jgi:hypothetical protein